MSQKKLPSKITSEELLAALESDDVSEFDTRGSEEGDVVKFLQEYNLKPGKEVISTKLLYSYYRKWTHRKISQTAFSSEITKYIPRRQAFFEIDKSAFKITEDLKELTNIKDTYKKDHTIECFLKFKAAYKIKKGSYYIQPTVLYYLYDNFPKSKHLKYVSFVRLCEFHFPKKIDDSGTWFCISPNIKEFLTDEVLEKALNWAEKHYGKEAKKKQQEKIKEVSGSRKESKS